MADITLTFGKHSGKKLREVPMDYVRWLSEQATICGKRDIPLAAQALLASKPAGQPDVVHDKECSYCHRSIDGQAVPMQVKQGKRFWTEYLHSDCARQMAEED